MTRQSASSSRRCANDPAALRARMPSNAVPWFVRGTRRYDWRRPNRGTGSRARLARPHHTHSTWIVHVTGRQAAIPLVAWDCRDCSAVEDNACLGKSEARVKFVGAMPQAELAWTFAAADVVVSASHREGPPHFAPDALERGKRFVASMVGDAPHVSTESGLGEFVGDRSPATLASEVCVAPRRRYEATAVVERVAHLAWSSVGCSLEAVLAQAVEMAGYPVNLRLRTPIRYGK
jgi:hypothetical protein